MFLRYRKPSVCRKLKCEQDVRHLSDLRSCQLMCKYRATTCYVTLDCVTIFLTCLHIVIGNRHAVPAIEHVFIQNRQPKSATSKRFKKNIF